MRTSSDTNTTFRVYRRTATNWSSTVTFPRPTTSSNTYRKACWFRRGSRRSFCGSLVDRPIFGSSPEGMLACLRSWLPRCEECNRIALANIKAGLL